MPALDQTPRAAALAVILAAAACTQHQRAARPAHGEVQPSTWTIDTMHGGINFEVTHLGLSKTLGSFDEFGGTIRADSAHPANSSVEFFAKVASINTGVPARDEHLRAPDFFDAGKHPDITFKSTRVARMGDGYAVTGDLTLKGVTKSVTIPFHVRGPYTIQGYGDQPPRLGFEAEPITILRSDFGLGDTKPFPDGVMGVTNEVIVRISLEATPAE